MPSASIATDVGGHQASIREGPPAHPRRRRDVSNTARGCGWRAGEGEVDKCGEQGCPSQSKQPAPEQQAAGLQSDAPPPPPQPLAGTGEREVDCGRWGRREHYPIGALARCPFPAGRSPRSHCMQTQTKTGAWHDHETKQTTTKKHKKENVSRATASTTRWNSKPGCSALTPGSPTS